MVLLDSILPDGTGKDLANFIKKEQSKGKFKDLVVISLSGNSPDDQKLLYEDNNIISAFLQKPLTKEQTLNLQSFVKSKTKVQ